MKTITKVLLVLLVVGVVTVASILANGVSDVGLANDAPTLESQPGPYLSVKEALPPLESQAGPFLSAKEVLPSLESQAGPERVLPGPLPQFPTVLECFLTFSTSEPQNKPVWLWTQNFGDDFVRVNGTTILMCEGAVKTGPTTITFDLTESQEVPPTGSAATGTCTGVLSADQSSFQLDCTHDVAGVLTGAHIHPGAVGSNGPVRVSLGAPASPINFTWDASSTPPLTPADVDALLAGGLYVNVHSTTFPGGEIRGQIPATVPTGAIGSLTPPVVFACYLITEGRISNDPYQLVTKNFGPDDVRVLDAIAMCESASKTRVDGSTFGHPGGHVLELFTISGGMNPNTDVILETENFGRHRARIGEAIALMEEAKKTPPPNEPPTGDGTGRVWECFVEEAPLLQDFEQVRLETANFAPDDVFVFVQPVVMCEEANKLKTFPTSTSIFGLTP